MITNTNSNTSIPNNKLMSNRLDNLTRLLLLGASSSPACAALVSPISSKNEKTKSTSVSAPPAPKPFSCHKCQRTFNSKYNVIRHLKQYHADKRMFKCDICGRDYKWVDSLHKHMKLHRQQQERDKLLLVEENNNNERLLFERKEIDEDRNEIDNTEDSVSLILLNSPSNETITRSNSNNEAVYDYRSMSATNLNNQPKGVDLIDFDLEEDRPK